MDEMMIALNQTQKQMIRFEKEIEWENDTS